MTTTPTSTSRLSLSPAAATAKTLNSLKRLNSLLLPINYRDAFYRDIQTSATSSALSLVASYEHPTSSTIVGGIRACWEPPLPSPPPPAPSCQQCTTTSKTNPQPRGGRVYIMTICVLSPFRRLGVATTLLTDVLRTARDWGVVDVYAHVWEENFDALEWYARRGFAVEPDVITGYYRKLKPDGARVVRLTVGAGDVLAAAAAAACLTKKEEKGDVEGGVNNDDDDDDDAAACLTKKEEEEDDDDGDDDNDEQEVVVGS